MTTKKEENKSAAGPWIFTNDRKPPRDGRLIIGEWSFGTMTARWDKTDKRWLEDDDKYPMTFMKKDPVRWAEIRL